MTGRLLSAGQVLAGPEGERLVDGAVLVEGDTIVAVGAREELETRAGADAVRIHRPGGTLLPGLIDAHVHLAFTPGVGLEEGLAGVDDTDLLLTMVGHARTLLDAGVTTARDLGDRGGLARRLRDAIAADRLAGPRLLVSGAPLTPPGGHCWFLGGEVDPHDPTALRAAVAARAAERDDLVKVMASGGQTTPSGAAMWEPQFDAAALGVIVDEAARHGLPVAAHAHGPDSIADATTAGVHTVEHCSWISGRGTSDYRPDVVDAMAAGGVVACSGSAGWWRRMVEVAGEDRARELFGRMRRMADQGVQVIIGTDAGLNPFDALPRAAANWSAWGFPPARMLAMVTTEAAEVLGLGAVTGRLAPGLAADVVLVDGDPLADLDVLAAPELVLARGRAHRPGA